ncbi:MAG: helix-turn-helix transcriptional regulator [Arenicellales bacterium]
MAQSEDLIDALKRELRRRGLTYANVAGELDLSESSVKRMFASRQFNLQRLEKICDLVDLEIGDLARLADERRRDIEQLTEEQEQVLVKDPKLLLTAFLLLNHWTVEKITGSYDIDDLEAIRLLARLDQLKIIDLLPGNRVRMRLSRTFSWRPNGPIQRLFETQVQSEFFHSRFNRPGELRLVLNGMLSDQSIGLMHQRMQRVAAEFEHCVSEDHKTVVDERLGTTLIMAIRPWALSMFEVYRRE